MGAIGGSGRGGASSSSGGSGGGLVYNPQDVRFASEEAFTCYQVISRKSLIWDRGVDMEDIPTFL